MIRWRMELMRLLPIDPRLRIFRGDGRGWLNPFNGEVVEDITREDGKITVRTVMAMARALSTCAQAQAGRMLDNATLMARSQALGISQQARQSSSVFGNQELSDDLARAKNVQQHMLAQLPQVEGFELAVHYSAHSGVSGDFYEVITLHDRRILMLLGDVSGHGMQAALVVATALKTLRFIARQTADLVTLLTQFNNEIKGDLIPGQFITLFAAVLDPVNSRLTCVRAGHHPALIANLDSGMLLRKVGNQGIAIGLVGGNIFQQSLNPETVALQPGDILLQYTDGLVEAMDSDQQEYGEARLYGSFVSRLELPLQELVDGIAKDVGEFAGGNVGDDITLFSLAVYEPEEAGEGDDQPQQ
jgi:sigma-B regulation protein RsbU (phosphoserine phosphatase)